MNLKRLCGLLLLLVAWPLGAATDIDCELTEAREVFLRAVDGDKRAVRDATQRFRTLSQAHPQEAVFVAYLGACGTLQGRDAANNIDKRRLTENGLREVDRARKMLTPDTDPVRYLDTLLVATNSYIHIPTFFNRHDDGKRLLEEILAHPAFDGMAGGYRAAAYMAAALIAQGEGDNEGYRRYLALGVEADPEGRDGRLAGSLLEE